MKKGLIIQGIKTKTSVSVFVSTLFYVFLASFFIEGGLWLSSELVGPFSIAIGYLTEFFSPGNGVASIQEFFFHYILYYELFSFVFILLLFIFLNPLRVFLPLLFIRQWIRYKGERNEEKITSMFAFLISIRCIRWSCSC